MLDKICSLRPITFLPRERDGSQTSTEVHTGFVADELQMVFPSLVTGEPGAVNADGKPQLQSVYYAGLTPHLTKAIQELVARVAALEARLP